MAEPGLPRLIHEKESGLDEELAPFLTRSGAEGELVELAVGLQMAGLVPTVRSLLHTSSGALQQQYVAFLQKTGRGSRRTWMPGDDGSLQSRLEQLLAHVSMLLAPSASTPQTAPPLHGTLRAAPLSLLELHRQMAEREMAVPSRFITCGCRVIDRAIGGGFPRGQLTEVVGEAGSGKTQLCLQALIKMQRVGDEGQPLRTGILIRTESYFPASRFRQLESLHRQTDAAYHRYSFGSGVCLEEAGDLEVLWHVLTNRIPVLMQRCPTVCFIVIDSIAALFRVEYAASQSFQRAEALWKIGSALKSIASRHHLAVVLVNQVTDSFQPDDLFLSPDHSSSSFSSSSSQKQPALGLAWSHCINTRISLSRTARIHDHPPSPDHSENQPPTGPAPPAKRHRPLDSTQRELTLVMSSYAPTQRCFFEITASGVSGFPPP